MNSFDIFDTLISRGTIGNHLRLFDEVGRRIGISDFRAKRIAAERIFQAQQLEYTLEDIYEELGMPHHAQTEWDLELECVQPIKQNIHLLDLKKDILVSDMYLGEDRVRILLKKAGINFDGPIFISCYGKLTGAVWDEIKKQNLRPDTHRGDNPNTDVRSPNRFGIRGLQVRTQMNEVEKFYAQYDENLAWWIRSARLKHILVESREQINFFEIQYNAPLLWSISARLYDYFNERNLNKFLFMARDTFLLQHFFDTLYPDIPHEYLFISRDALLKKSDSYMKYLNKRLKKDTSLVDLSASCGSLKFALDKIKIRNPKIFTAILLQSPFNVDLTGMDVTYMTTNMQTTINNTYLEMLNYANHLHVADVNEKEVPTLDLEGEYNMDLVHEYHDIIFDMLKSIPRPKKFHEEVFFRALNEIQKNKQTIGKYFASHIQFEMKRKSKVKMERPKDNVVIIGAIHKLIWNDIQHWYRSLNLTGFNGDIHMMCYDIDVGTIRLLEQNGIIVHNFELTSPQVVIDRFRDLPKVLKDIPAKQWVVFPDVSDIVFQYNPVTFLSSVQDYSLVVAHEGVKFQGNKWMLNNLRTSFPAWANMLKDKYFYNAGSIAARTSTFMNLASEIYLMCTSQATKGSTSHDQTAMNIILYDQYLRDALLTGPNDLWAFNGASSLFSTDQEDKANYKGKPVRIANGWCFNNDTKKPCILHHYTRISTYRAQVQMRVDRQFRAAGRR